MPRFILPMGDQKDRVIIGMAMSGDFRVIAAQTTETLEAARLRADLSPLAADALGRTLTGAMMLTRVLDKQVPQQHISLRIDGNGPMSPIICEATIEGHVRGYVGEPQYAGDGGSLAAAVGSKGTLTLARKAPPMGRPYTSQVSLVSGEIAKDIAHYLAKSEQIPSAVLLGVFNRPTGVAAAGGIIIQAFPHASEESRITIEERIRKAPPLSSLLDAHSIEEAVALILHDTEYKQFDPALNIPISYHCHCTRERALELFRYFSPQEIAEMIQEEKDSEAVCQFCGQIYTFSSEDLMSLPMPPSA